MANIPRGSLAFGAFADSAWKFHSTAGVDLGAPPSGAPNGAGKNGLVALDSGIVCVVGCKSPFNVSPHFYNYGAFDPQLSAFTGDNSGPSLLSIACNYTDRFYAIYPTNPGNFELWVFNNAGAKIGSYDLGFGGTGAELYAVGVNPAETVAYYIQAAISDTVSKRTLSGSTTTFATETGYYTTVNGLLVLRNGDVLVGWSPDGGLGTAYTKRYNSSGVLQATYTHTGGIGADTSVAVITPALTDTSFWLSFYDDSLVSSPDITVQEIEISTGNILHSFNPDDGMGFEYDGPFFVVRVSMGAPVAFVPAPVTPAPQTPCAPQTQVTGGGKGNFGCNPGGVGWTSSYSGPYGTVPVHADPVDGELLTGKVGVDAWIDLVHVDYPSSAVTTYYRALAELGDASTYQGGRKPAGLLSFGAIDHGLGNEQGGYSASGVTLKLSDVYDRFIRDLSDTQDLEYDEVRVKLASPAARAAAAAPRVVFRGVVQQSVLSNPVQSDLSVVDSIFADFGPFGPNRQWPGTIPKAVFPDAPADVLNTPAPWLYGEKTDHGATDPATNKPASKGVMPLYYVGQELITRSVQMPIYQFDPSLDVMEDAASVTIAGTTWGTNPTLDNKFFTVVAVINGKLSPETFLDNTLNFPGNFPTVTPYDQRVVWTIRSGYVMPVGSFFICWMYDSGPWNPNRNPYVVANPRFKIVAPVVTSPAGPPTAPVDHIGQAWEYSCDWTSLTDGAEWTNASGTVQTVTEAWDAYLASMSPIYLITDVFGSDLGNGSSSARHDRVVLDIDARTDILVPKYANWPFSTTYREYLGSDGVIYWVTMVYAKGPLSDDAKNGVVNMAFNGLGVEDVGDGTGLPIIDAHDCEQHWIENVLLNNWTSGLWTTNTTYPKWEDNTPKVRTTSFAARQAYTATSYGGRGLTIGWYVDRNQGVPAWFKEWNDSTESRIGINGHGQVMVWGIDETLDPTNWPAIRHQSDIFGNVKTTSGIERENVVSGQCDWDSDASKFRVPPTLPFKSPGGILKYKNHEKKGKSIDSVILNDANQLNWVLGKRLVRMQFGTKQISIDGVIGFMDNDVPAGVLLTSIEGTGTSGYVDRACTILRRKLDIDSHVVTLTLLDMKTLLLATAYTNGLASRPIVTDTSANAPIVTNTTNNAPLVLT